jgi:hypothetical protein
VSSFPPTFKDTNKKASVYAMIMLQVAFIVFPHISKRKHKIGEIRKNKEKPIVIGKGRPYQDSVNTFTIEEISNQMTAL